MQVMLGKIQKDDLLQSVTKLPVLSEVVVRALKLIDDPNCTIRELTDLISKDQSITAKLIKLANSAFYGFPRKIHSLSEAFIVLGFKTVRSLLITASVSDILKESVEGYIITRGELWKHSYAVAFTAGNIAKSVRKSMMDTAFTSGILHDIGKLILGNYLKGSYQEVISLAEKAQMNLAMAEEKLLGYNHAQVGGLVLDAWNFPEVIVKAVSNHHQLTNQDEHDPLTDILHVADGWVLEKGVGIIPKEFLYEYDSFIQKTLGLNEENKTEILLRLNDEIDVMNAIFTDEKGVKLSMIREEGEKKKIKAF